MKIQNQIREKIRHQADLLEELEFLELIEAAQIHGFEIVLKKPDGTLDKLTTASGQNPAIQVMRGKYFSKKFLPLISEYKEFVEKQLESSGAK